MSRPFVFINVAATADGKIDTFERAGAAISSARDKQRVDALRAAVDAVMIGGRTLHDEDPKLTVKSKELRRERESRGLPANPIKVAVASHLRLQPDCQFLNAGPARILFFTTAQAPRDQLEMLRARGAQVFTLPGERPELEEVLRVLHNERVRRLMVEGGATLNFELLRLGLVDEITVFVAPMLFGGETAPTLAGSAGFPRASAISLKLLSSEPWDDGGVLLHYQVLR